jgi:hypothetical protein
MLLIGTRKGLFFLEEGQGSDPWVLQGPHFLGHIMQHAVADPRSGRILVAASTGHLGPTVFWTEDRGRSWNEAAKPPAFRTGERLARSLTAVFWLTPGHSSQPGVWFAGGSPQGLFRSDDGGEHWAPVDGWNDHPMWETWAEWPEQNTPDGSMLHSVCIDPRDPDHCYLGLSSGGVFESHDGMRTWHPLNAGLASPIFPDKELEFGQDPHCIRIHPAKPDRLYQQNHCGIYRLDRPATRWERIGLAMPTDVGDIGFPIELDPDDADVAWVFPMDGTDVWPRTSPDGRPAAYRTDDAGASWVRCDGGLPERAWFTVKRQAMMTAPGRDGGLRVAFGTTSGEVWVSADRGATWTCAAAHLPEIYSVEPLASAGASR